MKQIKTYRFKLKPTDAQERIFEQWLGTCRYVYNLCLEYRIVMYKGYNISVGKYSIQKEITQIRKEVPWIKAVPAKTLQNVTDRLFITYDNFLKRGASFPKFAKRRNYKSITFTEDVKHNGGFISFPKMGDVRFVNSQSINGTIKRASIIKEVNGWYVCLCCEVEIEALPPNDKSIGLDLGIKSFVVSSEGQEITNPKHLFKYQYQLRRAQRSVSRKKKGGANRRKAINKLARVHLKVRNARKDFHHKLSTQFIRENQAIAVEDLKVKNMVRNHNLAKSISDAGWSQFIQILEYKAKWYGRDFVKVDARHTSQDCSVCGWRNTEMKLSDRVWTCANGHVLDRDINAAINIKKKAVGHTASASEIYNRNSGVAEESNTGVSIPVLRRYGYKKKAK